MPTGTSAIQAFFKRLGTNEVMQALEKERSRRYSTLNALPRDSERNFNNSSAEARRPSARYHLQQLVVGNRTIVVTALAILPFILCGATISVWKAIRASRVSTVALQNERRACENEANAVRATVAERIARSAEAREHDRVELKRDAGTKEVPDTLKDVPDTLVSYAQARRVRRAGDVPPARVNRRMNDSGAELTAGSASRARSRDSSPRQTHNAASHGLSPKG